MLIIIMMIIYLKFRKKLLIILIKLVQFSDIGIHACYIIIGSNRAQPPLQFISNSSLSVHLYVSFLAYH